MYCLYANVCISLCPSFFSCVSVRLASVYLKVIALKLLFSWIFDPMQDAQLCDLYVNGITITAISEYMKEWETSSFPVFISSKLYSLMICIWLQSHPHCFTQVGYTKIATVTADDYAAAVHRAVFPPCFLCVDVCLPFTLQWEARPFSQVGQWMPKGLHLCKTPIRDIKLNCL